MSRRRATSLPQARDVRARNADATTVEHLLRGQNRNLGVPAEVRLAEVRLIEAHHGSFAPWLQHADEPPIDIDGALSSLPRRPPEAT